MLAAAPGRPSKLRLAGLWPLPVSASGRTQSGQPDAVAEAAGLQRRPWPTGNAAGWARGPATSKSESAPGGLGLRPGDRAVDSESLRVRLASVKVSYRDRGVT